QPRRRCCCSARPPTGIVASHSAPEQCQTSGSRRHAADNLRRGTRVRGAGLSRQSRSLAISEDAMSANGLDVFDKTLQTTHIWLDEVMAAIGPNRKVAWKVLSTVLHKLRDRTPV